jgi:site-specific DNA-methyltransferase (adenine-specific)
MFSSKSEMWETPQNFFDKLDKEFRFDVDACAISENAKCRKFYTPEEDGLSKDWDKTTWCNPPYGRKIGDWVRKAYYQSKKFGSTIVMLLPARTDTKWFHEYIYNKDWIEIRFVKGRLKFGGSKWNAPFPCMVVVFRGSCFHGKLKEIG